MICMSEYENPMLTTDILIELEGGIVLVKRKYDPFRGKWAIPGGFVEYGEKVEDAAVREAREETNLEVELGDILGVYSEMGRDPRGHVVTICYRARKVGGDLEASSDAAGVKVFKEIPWNDLAFDHEKVLKEYLKDEK